MLSKTTKALKEVRKMVRAILENSVIEEDYPPSFDMEHFKALKNFAQRVAYCQQHLQRISSGSSRIVYKIDDEKVLKLAKNKKGIAQNETEISYSNYPDIDDIITKAFSSDISAFWVEMEFAKPVRKGDFKRITGYDFEDYCAAIYNYFQVVTGKTKLTMKVDKELETSMWENEFTYAIFNFIGNYKIPVGDLMRISSYGIVNRNGAETIVLVDFGLTHEVHSTHYSNHIK